MILSKKRKEKEMIRYFAGIIISKLRDLKFWRLGLKSRRANRSARLKKNKPSEFNEFKEWPIKRPSSVLNDYIIPFWTIIFVVLFAVMGFKELFFG